VHHLRAFQQCKYTVQITQMCATFYLLLRHLPGMRVDQQSCARIRTLLAPVSSPSRAADCAAFEFLLKHYQQRTFDQAVSQAKSQSFNDIAEYFVTQARWHQLSLPFRALHVLSAGQCRRHTSVIHAHLPPLTVPETHSNINFVLKLVSQASNTC